MDKLSDARILMFEYSKQGNIEELAKLYNDGYKFPVHCGYIAASNRDLNTLKWLHAHECQINEFTVLANVIGITECKFKSLPVYESHFLSFTGRATNPNSHINYTCEILDWFKSISFDFNLLFVPKYERLNMKAANWFIENGYKALSIEMINYMYCDKEDDKDNKMRINC